MSEAVLSDLAQSSSPGGADGGAETFGGESGIPMGRELNRLTARGVLNLSSAGRHADGGNLFLSISPNGGRRWVFLFRWRGGRVELGLGSARNVSLAQARALAKEARDALATGTDPRSIRRISMLQAPVEELPSLPTFGDAADELIASMSPSWKNEKHRAQWTMTMKVYAAGIRKKAVEALTTEDILNLLRPIWYSKPETASRVRGRIERILDAAKVKGWRSGENPARWRGHLDQLLPAAKKLSRGHHAALPCEELPSFFAQLRRREAPAARAFEFLILSAARSDEVRSMQVKEANLGKALWTVPAIRMKASREHRVPICSYSVGILRDVTADLTPDDFTFRSGKPGKPLSETAFQNLLERMGYGHVTPHGFRSTFKDWAAERTSFANEVSEMALAHVIGDKTEAAYRRGDLFEKRRGLMEAWANYCLTGSSSSH